MENENKELEVETASNPDNSGLVSIFIDAINRVWACIDNYNSILVTLNDMDRHEFDETIKEILAEKNKEVGLIQGMLELLSPNVENIQAGAEEALDNITVQTESLHLLKEEDAEDISDIRNQLYINGDLEDFSPRALADKCEKDKCAYHSNRKLGDDIYQITIDPGYLFGAKKDSDKCWVDIIKSDIYNDNQQRIYLQSFNNLDDLVDALNEWKENSLA